MQRQRAVWRQRWRWSRGSHAPRTCHPGRFPHGRETNRRRARLHLGRCARCCVQMGRGSMRRFHLTDRSPPPTADRHSLVRWRCSGLMAVRCSRDARSVRRSGPSGDSRRWSWPTASASPGRSPAPSPIPVAGCVSCGSTWALARSMRHWTESRVSRFRVARQSPSRKRQMW